MPLEGEEETPVVEFSVEVRREISARRVGRLAEDRAAYLLQVIVGPVRPPGEMEPVNIEAAGEGLFDFFSDRLPRDCLSGDRLLNFLENIHPMNFLNFLIT